MWQRNVPISYFDRENMRDEAAEHVEHCAQFPRKLWGLATAGEGGFRWGRGGALLMDRAALAAYLAGPASAFKTRDVNSLIRQLNMYGFKKLPPLSCGHADCFSHPMFLPASPRLLSLVTRQPPPSSSSGSVSRPKQTPTWPGRRNVAARRPSPRLLRARADLRAAIEKAYAKLDADAPRSFDPDPSDSIDRENESLGSNFVVNSAVAEDSEILEDTGNYPIASLDDCAVAENVITFTLQELDENDYVTIDMNETDEMKEEKSMNEVSIYENTSEEDFGDILKSINFMENDNNYDLECQQFDIEWIDIP